MGPLLKLAGWFREILAGHPGPGEIVHNDCKLQQLFLTKVILERATVEK
jgi:hypothetical protein